MLARLRSANERSSNKRSETLSNGNRRSGGLSLQLVTEEIEWKMKITIKKTTIKKKKIKIVVQFL